MKRYFRPAFISSLKSKSKTEKLIGVALGIVSVLLISDATKCKTAANFAQGLNDEEIKLEELSETEFSNTD
jgi:hypothetical protein